MTTDVHKAKRNLRDCYDPESTNPSNIVNHTEELIRAVFHEEEGHNIAWRVVAIDSLERILNAVEPKSFIAQEATVALAALRSAKGR